MDAEEAANKAMKKLVEEASQLKYMPNVPLKIYLRSANSLFLQANRYKEEDDLLNAYKFYMRYATLALEKLPQNSDYKKPEYKSGRLELVKTSNLVLKEIEELKPKLKRYFLQVAEEEAAEKTRNLNVQVEYQSQTPQVIPVSNTEWDLAEQLKNLHLGTSSKTITMEEQPHLTVQYPGISTRNQSDGYTYTAREIPSPALPPKIMHDAPKIPPKPRGYDLNLHSEKADNKVEPPPEFAAYTEGGEGLRKVCLSDSIYDVFIKIAANNTAKNLETCGILFGVLTRNVFYVTTLIIPKQTATSDTCTMTNEEELIEYQEQKGLIMLGWIHTHPSQTCFMSSMDLHTHSSYQVISPEAIAIVCSPKHQPKFGIFRLTNPPGLQTVLQCTQRGFHPHDSSSPIEKEISHNGHVEMKRMDLEIIDLR